jgi:hypothetical protein
VIDEEKRSFGGFGISVIKLQRLLASSERDEHKKVIDFAKNIQEKGDL